MKFIKIILILLIVIMAFTIFYAVTEGDFSRDGKALLNNPWGIMSLIDLYAGFVVSLMWIFYKERSLLSKCFWFIAIMITGFLAVSVYCLIELTRSKGNLETFFLRKTHL